MKKKSITVSAVLAVCSTVAFAEEKVMPEAFFEEAKAEPKQQNQLQEKKSPVKVCYEVILEKPKNKIS